jgi:hypothetical protein
MDSLAAIFCVVKKRLGVSCISSKRPNLLNEDQLCDGEGRISDERFLQDFEVLTSQTPQLLAPLALRKAYSARSDEAGLTILEGGL